ncbi:type VII secretion-associated serine protease mycosin [Mycolicibacterium sp. F2034L]|uniref:type VII secretion-associated serine protease mycosin n=1 Tax=Mycolicibacterium sp. F2034L TaxID=2926422 RepID=UPI001FF6A716|nr:type VII secretion-associated serine protease mycosin [Mycolicibacterium sp. F2034L]MCK0177280.1 type VII secretion-associated serine protease mycosin [Mycolicibacterium sp. F2034L]
MNRPLAVLAATSAVALLSCPSAVAITPPEIDPAVPPPAGAGPVDAMEQRGACVTSAVMPGTDPGAVSPNSRALNLSGAWEYSRGEGQLVAVIDTGVVPGPRLPDVQAGGDFLGSTDGLTDCDGHGTLVAGLIAGRPGPDGFSGVAPAAQILSIRQTSPRYAPAAPSDDPALQRAAIDTASLARAIVRAADGGARVINVSVVTCLPAGQTLDQTELGAALRYATREKDAVVIAAAGNNAGGMTTGTACASNPPTDPGRPDDPRNWSGVTTVSIPSWWQPYVLSVGSLTPAGQPSEFTMAGPWLGIAAPGEDIVSLSNAPGGGLADGLPDDKGNLFPLSGTSYATAYVSGVAALVRSRFPQLTSEQVVRRLTASAHGGARSPSSVVGAGSVDPVAALTWELPAEPAAAPPTAKPIAAPPVPEPPDHTPRTVALIGSGVLALAAGSAVVVSRRRKDTV